MQHLDSVSVIAVAVVAVAVAVVAVAVVAVVGWESTGGLNSSDADVGVQRRQRRWPASTFRQQQKNRNQKKNLIALPGLPER